MSAICSHISHIKNVHPHTKGCEECLKMGDSWVHLRLCRECGHVGCCDSSKNKHATKHFHASKHPIMQSSSQAKVGCGVSWIKLSSRHNCLSALPFCVSHLMQTFLLLFLSCSVAMIPHDYD